MGVAGDLFDTLKSLCALLNDEHVVSRAIAAPIRPDTARAKISKLDSR